MPRLTLLPLPGHPSNPDGQDPALRALTLEVPRGQSVLDAASEAGFLVATRCGGVADCRACRVEVPLGAHREEGLSPLDAFEQEALDEIDASPRARLSCQAYVIGDVTVLVPDPRTMEDE